MLLFRSPEKARKTQLCPEVVFCEGSLSVFSRGWQFHWRTIVRKHRWQFMSKDLHWKPFEVFIKLSNHSIASRLWSLARRMIYGHLALSSRILPDAPFRVSSRLDAQSGLFPVMSLVGNWLLYLCSLVWHQIKLYVPHLVRCGCCSLTIKICVKMLFHRVLWRGCCSVDISRLCVVSWHDLSLFRFTGRNA